MLHLVSGAGGNFVSCDCLLTSEPRLAYIWDHQVSGRAVFPGAGYLELAAALVAVIAGHQAPLLVGATIPAPLVLPLLTGLKEGIVLRGTLQRSTGTASVISSISKQQPHLTTGAAVALPEKKEGGNPVASTLGYLLRLNAAVAPGCSIGDVLNVCDSSEPLNAAVLDSCLHLAAAGQMKAGPLRVPVGLEALCVSESKEASLGAACREDSSDGSQLTVTYKLGSCGVHGLSMKPLSRAGDAQAAEKSRVVAQQELLYETGWLAECVAAPLPQSPQVSFSDEMGALSLAAAGVAAMQVAVNAAHSGLTLTTSAARSSSIVPAAALNSSSALHGLMRAVSAEYSSKQFSTVDVSNGGSGLSLSLEPTAAVDAYGVAIEAKQQHVAGLSSSRVRMGPAGPFQLLPQPRGALTNLKPVELSIAGGDKVTIAVKAVGLNFRDVLNVLGMYPGDPGPPGADCAGVVVKATAEGCRLVVGRCLVLLLAAWEPCSVLICAWWRPC